MKLCTRRHDINTTFNILIFWRNYVTFNSLKLERKLLKLFPIYVSCLESLGKTLGKKIM